MAFWGHFNADQVVYDVTNKNQPYVIRKMHRNHKLIKNIHSSKLLSGNSYMSCCRAPQQGYSTVGTCTRFQLVARACVCAHGCTILTRINRAYMFTLSWVHAHPRAMHILLRNTSVQTPAPSSFEIRLFFLSFFCPHGVKQPGIWAPSGEEDIDWYISGIDYTLH